ncbi:MAG TPA: Rieske (2Fe-2S) protein [Vicinamibacterales bacterium]|nr:Rieske (2Fe-2S) protein [Vicinamibacterales bacterium]HJN44999.1 Rieske (2Fe-2S) protein [Vicinamibacterales bacterium]
MERRRFLGRASHVAMAAGLAGGYGGLGLIAGRFLSPSGDTGRVWQFLVETDQMVVGESREYRGPAGETVNVTRRGRGAGAEDFIALSSTCPHLGCQVNWEVQNDRYFCPCHNGTFDSSGLATDGPPADAGQNLPPYPLRVERGMLFIEVQVDRLVSTAPHRLSSASASTRLV